MENRLDINHLTRKPTLALLIFSVPLLMLICSCELAYGTSVPDKEKVSSAVGKKENYKEKGAGETKKSSKSSSKKKGQLEDMIGDLEDKIKDLEEAIEDLEDETDDLESKICRRTSKIDDRETRLKSEDPTDP